MSARRSPRAWFAKVWGRDRLPRALSAPRGERDRRIWFETAARNCRRCWSKSLFTSEKLSGAGAIRRCPGPLRAKRARRNAGGWRMPTPTARLAIGKFGSGLGAGRDRSCRAGSGRFERLLALQSGDPGGAIMFYLPAGTRGPRDRPGLFRWSRCSPNSRYHIRLYDLWAATARTAI